MPRKNNDPRSLLEKPEGTEYGVVTKKLGGSNFSVKLNGDNKEVIARLCGKFKYKSNKKKNHVDVQSIVLVGIRDFQDGKVDLVYLYTAAEVRQLKKLGVLQLDDSLINLNDGLQTNDSNDINNIGFDFDDI